MRATSRPNTLVTWLRRTASLLDSTAIASTHTPDRQPVQASHVRVSLTGSPSGVLTVQGVANGYLDEEALTFSGSAGAETTLRSFSTLNTIVADGVSGGVLIDVKAVGGDGHPKHRLRTLKSRIPVCLYDVSQRRWTSPTPGEGSHHDAEVLLDYEDVWSPRKGDVVSDTITGEHYEVSGSNRPQGSLLGGAQPRVVRLKRRQGLGS